jgi:hypothetical protein
VNCDALAGEPRRLERLLEPATPEVPIGERALAAGGEDEVVLGRVLALELHEQIDQARSERDVPASGLCLRVGELAVPTPLPPRERKLAPTSAYGKREVGRDERPSPIRKALHIRADEVV